MTDRLLRAVDAVIAALVLAIFGPVLVLVAIVLRVGQGAPVLYRAPRVARGGDTFEMLKFRTMTIGSDSGASSTSADDMRVTPLGRWLRRFKLDELPQFINVLRGEMSLVGPRPQVRWAVERYEGAETRLTDVRPGITDYASIWFADEGERLAGSMDPDADYLRLIAPGKTALSLFYVNNRSLRRYLQIISLTAAATLGREVRHTVVQATGISADELAETDS